MQITIGSFFPVRNYNNQKKYSNLAPLEKDTVSFGIRKSQLDGIDLAVKEKFKPEIEKFKTNEEFQDWCGNKLETEYLNRKFNAVYDYVTDEREYILQRWIDYCLYENDTYTDAARLFIIDGITSKLKEDNDTLPPELNKGILADTLFDIQEKIKKNIPVSFLNEYNANFIKSSLEDLTGDETGNYTGWLEIEGGDYTDSAIFYDNVKKLKALSHPNWCTSSVNAQPYLSEGDFNIYMENGKPKLGVRFNRLGNIEEVQGEKNNGKIPLEYFDILKERFNDYEFMSDKAVHEYNNAEQSIEHHKNFETEYGKPIEEATIEEVLKFENMYAYRDEDDDSIILTRYSQPDDALDWVDIGVNENELFKNIKRIEGNANFRRSKILSLGKLEVIEGSVIFAPSGIKDLGSLKIIGGNADFKRSNLKNLGQLEKIGGKAIIRNSNITSEMLKERGFEEETKKGKKNRQRR